jgi:hypothetical protein
MRGGCEPAGPRLPHRVDKVRTDKQFLRALVRLSFLVLPRSRGTSVLGTLRLAVVGTSGDILSPSILDFGRHNKDQLVPPSLSSHSTACSPHRIVISRHHRRTPRSR